MTIGARSRSLKKKKNRSGELQKPLSSQGGGGGGGEEKKKHHTNTRQGMKETNLNTVTAPKKRKEKRTQTNEQSSQI